MAFIELLQDELIIASAAFRIPIQGKSIIKQRREVQPSTSIKADTWGIYFALVNELSVFGETIKQ